MAYEQSILDLGLGDFGSKPYKKRTFYIINRTRRTKKLPTDGQPWLEFENTPENLKTETILQSEALPETTGTEDRIEETCGIAEIENLHHFEETTETNETENIYHIFTSAKSKISHFLNSIKKWVKENFNINSIIMIFLTLLGLSIALVSHIANNNFNKMFFDYIVEHVTSFYKNQIIIIENQHALLLKEEQILQSLNDLKSKIAELENKLNLLLIEEKKSPND